MNPRSKVATAQAVNAMVFFPVRTMGGGAR